MQKNEAAAENTDTKNKLDQLKKKFQKTEENPLPKPEPKIESSPNKFDELQKELEKKLNNLNQPKKEDPLVKSFTVDSQPNNNKINLNDYRAQLRQKFAAPASDSNIPLETAQPKTESNKTHFFSRKFSDFPEILNFKTFNPCLTLLKIFRWFPSQENQHQNCGSCRKFGESFPRSCSEPSDEPNR